MSESARAPCSTASGGHGPTRRVPGGNRDQVVGPGPIKLMPAELESLSVSHGHASENTESLRLAYHSHGHGMHWRPASSPVGKPPGMSSGWAGRPSHGLSGPGLGRAGAKLKGPLTWRSRRLARVVPLDSESASSAVELEKSNFTRVELEKSSQDTLGHATKDKQVRDAPNRYNSGRPQLGPKGQWQCSSWSES
jgi:hypothetical protein